MTALYDVLRTSFATLSRYEKRIARYNQRLDECVQLLDEYRFDHPGGGLVKAYNYFRYHLENPLVDGISRDRFVAGMTERGRVLDTLPPTPKTTQSGTYRFDNQTRDLLVTHPDQLWVSDTTYYTMNTGKWAFITFIVDVYTRVILGWAASSSLKADANLKALKMAKETRGAVRLSKQEVGMVFHTDGGKQFMEKDFLKSLKEIKASSSMGFVAQENAIAERVNGIIKNEFLRYWPESRRSLNKLELCVARAVEVYNTIRLHNSLPESLSPSNFERSYAEGLHREYCVHVKKWNHDPYYSTDKIAGKEPAT